MSKRRSAKK